MTEQEIQRDENIKDSLIEFINRFTIVNDDEFDKVVAFYRIDTNMQSDNSEFLCYLETIKEHLQSKTDNVIFGKYIKNYITIVDKIIHTL